MSTLCLHLDGVSYAPPGADLLLHNVHLHLVPGWTGLVGANGAGKTTLLRLLSGELHHPARRCEPSHLSVLRLDQRVEVPDARVVALADDWSKAACRLRARLDLVDDPLTTWASRSPGERRRWQLAAALHARPDALLLDEPDNHLDAAARRGLLDALSSYRGIGVVVSHDRAFLDALTASTVRVRRGLVEHQAHPVTAALGQWDQADAHARDQHALQAARARRAQRQLAEAAARHEAAGRARSLRHADRRDPDARSSAAKSRAAKAEAAHARAHQRARTHLQQAEAQRSGPPPRRAPKALALRTQGTRRRVLVELAPEEVEAPLPLSGPRLTVGARSRIWLSGPNGAGKSTLLTALLEASALPTDHVLHLPQELTDARIDDARRRLSALPSEDHGEVLVLLAALGGHPPRVLGHGPLSPGEARKLLLALALARGTALVALDEPTHHLDLPARQRLEAALRAFEGALLLVTHDEALADAVCEERWAMEAGILQVR
jgi:ATPase subunit of ABC transporter with duplicated ATPase domains